MGVSDSVASGGNGVQHVLQRHVQGYAGFGMLFVVHVIANEDDERGTLGNEWR